jgi:hypothetical protein
MVHTLEIQSITRAVTEVTTPARNTETVAHSMSETSTVMPEKPRIVSREAKDVLHRIRAA